jgi:hypothetical protein
MDSERLNERLVDFLKGVHQLERAVAQPFDEFTRDATIQRFGFCERLADEVYAFIGQQALPRFQRLAQEANAWKTR